jgi:hypothetical protein
MKVLALLAPLYALSAGQYLVLLLLDAALPPYEERE